MSLRIAIIASGVGSNVANIIAHAKMKRLDASICLVLSNRPEAGALQHARNNNIPVWVNDHRAFANRENFDNAMAEAILSAKADIIVLAGYMRLLCPSFIRRFKGRIINIHPAILPAFPGVCGGKDAADYGVRITGCTVHFVDEIMDNGPVIIQAAVPILDGETEKDFMPRVHAMEYQIYPQALQWLADHRLLIEKRAVRLIPTKKPCAQIFSVNVGEIPCLINPPLERIY